MFAVESIRRWWSAIGRLAYPEADRLLITADGGGSNGSRLRLWKTQLAQLAAETGLKITVCHLPPGTSKWNKIEHRMFSAITMNWRGRPLQTHEVVVETIAATTTKTGLSIQAVLDTNTYERGIKITDKEMKAFEAAHLQRHAFHGDWNYTVTGGAGDDATRPERSPAPRPRSTHLRPQPGRRTDQQGADRDSAEVGSQSVGQSIGPSVAVIGVAVDRLGAGACRDADVAVAVTADCDLHHEVVPDAAQGEHVRFRGNRDVALHVEIVALQVGEDAIVDSFLALTVAQDLAGLDREPAVIFGHLAAARRRAPCVAGDVVAVDLHVGRVHDVFDDAGEPGLGVLIVVGTSSQEQAS